jgi:hypothetical protein
MKSERREVDGIFSAASLGIDNLTQQSLFPAE